MYEAVGFRRRHGHRCNTGLRRRRAASRLGLAAAIWSRRSRRSTAPRASHGERGRRSGCRRELRRARRSTRGIESEHVPRHLLVAARDRGRRRAGRRRRRAARPPDAWRGARRRRGAAAVDDLPPRRPAAALAPSAGPADAGASPSSVPRTPSAPSCSSPTTTRRTAGLLFHPGDPRGVSSALPVADLERVRTPAHPLLAPGRSPIPAASRRGRHRQAGLTQAGTVASAGGLGGRPRRHRVARTVPGRQRQRAPAWRRCSRSRGRSPSDPPENVRVLLRLHLRGGPLRGDAGLGERHFGELPARAPSSSASTHSARPTCSCFAGRGC